MMLTVISKCLCHKPPAAIFMAAMATYNKSRSGSPSRSKQYGRRNSLSSRPRQHISKFFKEVEELDEAQDFLDFDKKDFVHKNFREEEKLQKKILYKVIEHKYFRRPQPLNLLTWDAKEQIRYLHAEFPDEWTLERLAESFPIDRDGLIKILKSKFMPRTIGEVIRHDKQVKQNWLKLKTGDSGKEGGPVALRYEELLDNSQLHLLGNAAGILSLPMPEMRRFLSAGKSNDNTTIARRDKMPGPFEAIVKGYCEAQKLTHVVDDAEKVSQFKKLLQENREMNQKLLESVAESTRCLSAKTQRCEHKAIVSGRGDWQTHSTSAGFNYVDENLQKPEPHTSLGSKGTDIQTLLDVDYPDIDVAPRRGSHRRRGLTASPRLDTVVEQVTGIVKTGEGRGQEFEGEDVARRRQYAPTPVDKRNVFDQIRYDVPHNLQYGHQEAYVYDKEKGYQHPLGKAARDIKQKIMVPEKSQSGETVYRQGRNYYDADGEFLYRVP